MRLEDFSWEAACPVPWNQGALAYFDYDEASVYAQKPVLFSRPLADQLSNVLRHFTAAVNFCGLRNTISRVTDLYLSRGDSVEQGWSKSLVAVSITVSGVNSITSDYLYQHARMVRDQPHCLEWTYAMSPLHCWALSEGMDYLSQDLLTQLHEQGGYPFAAEKLLASDAQALRLFLSPLIECFSGNDSPYFNLAELELI